MTPAGGSPLAGLGAPAVVDGPVRLEPDEVMDRARRLAGGLRDLGVRPGDAVAFQLPNSWQAVVLFHACWVAGARAAPIHHRVTAAEAGELLERLRPAVTFSATDLPALPAAVTVAGPRDGFIALCEAGEPLEPTEVPPHEVAVLLATSGSTGRPKIVRHTGRGLADKGRSMAAVHGLGPADTILMPAPLAHISGLLNGVLVAGAAGMRTVLMARWSAEAALELVERERVTFMIGPPTFFTDMMSATGFRPDRVASVRLISSGGAAVTPAFVARTGETFGCLVKRTYGSTEAPTVTTSHAGDPPERAELTDGRAVAGVELRVVDDRGHDLPPGTTGELLVRGPEVFIGYDDPLATAGALDADGWYRTGDLATLSPQGWLTIVGRASDTIIRGGENISPAEVESTCATLPGIRQAVVVGYPDERLGERIGLVVVADHAPALDLVREHCAAAGLAAFKLPERVLAVDVLPVLGSGKPDRAALTALVESTSTSPA
jgi:acyl-CoA synthetase (AMP-forming)/AMP-acid ligase II